MSENNTIQMNKGLSGFVLKLIACISMFIDHAGVVLYETYARVEGIHLGLLYRYDNPYGITYRTLRGIGRLAFPIFCYLIVEGYEHTRNKWKYLGRLILFAFISEYPFDIAFKGGAINWNSQNVYFT
ncbi:MAG: conjugal transfer protein TraX, partial [Erysipelotrichaceae bacterium]|nr:conjugal transfer protein TraX [Erysipelotrichaceae bacterium]